jgi:alkylation response protein AidB-like acyl-CoA dehydrogenase
MPPPAGSLLKLYGATAHMRRCEIGLELAGGAAAAWPPGDGEPTTAAAAARREAEASLFRQGGSLGGGSNEIQRNIISERVLGMPREHAADRDVPYREVRRG